MLEVQTLAVNIRMIIFPSRTFDDMVYCLSEGKSHAFYVYDRFYIERSFRMTNIHNNTRMFEPRVPNVRQVTNQFILILYNFSHIITPPPS